MKLITKLSFIVVLTMLAGTLGISAQQTSPYSKFGYGILSDNATSSQRQMGGTGYAQHSGRQVNAMNPAAYAAVDSMTFLFDMGVDLSRYWREDANGKAKDWGGGIDYITMQFPVSKHVGMSAGLVPFTSVGYAFGSRLENGVSTHQGSGGINQLYLGAGYSPLKGLSVGVNVGYLFGDFGNDVYVTPASSTGAVYEQVMEIHDYHLRFGAQYIYRISPERSLTLGVTFEPGKTLLGKTYMLKYLSGSSSAPDTVAPGVVKLRRKFSLASSWGVGVAYDWGDRLHAEVDFTYQPWKNAKFTNIDNFSATRLDDRFKIAAGASYMHNPRGNYLQRMTYRAGAYYNRDYMMVGDSHVKDFGVSCGFGFPASQSKTLINLGLEFMKRNASSSAYLSEKYFSITLGVNFNGTWFFRRQLR